MINIQSGLRLNILAGRWGVSPLGTTRADDELLDEKRFAGLGYKFGILNCRSEVGAISL